MRRTKDQKTKSQRETAEKLKEDLSIEDIFSENTEVACIALMKETSRVLKELGFKKVDVEISNGDYDMVISLKANPKVYSSDIVNVDKTHPAYKKAKEKMKKREELLKPFIDAFKDMKNAPKEITIGAVEKRTYQLTNGGYTGGSYSLIKINGQPITNPAYTYKDSNFTSYMFDKKRYNYHRYAAIKDPDESTKGAWITKKPRYSFGETGRYASLFSDTKEHIAIIMAAGTKLLTALKPEEYKRLNPIRDQYIASCLLGVTDMTFSEENEDE